MKPTSAQNTELWAESCDNFTLAPSYEWVREKLAGVKELALDFETTSLSPENGKVRLSSICWGEEHFIVDHFLVGNVRSLLNMLIGKHVFVYNGKFEQRWIDYHLPSEELDVLDVDFMAKSVIGGHHSSLEIMARRDLGIELDKEEQASDWSRPALTQSQMNYAAFDSKITWALKDYWDEQMTDAHWNGFYIFNDSVRSTVQCEVTGMPLDTRLHLVNTEMWKRRLRVCTKYFEKFAPGVNPASGKQLDEFMRTVLDDKTISVWPKTARKGQMQFESKYLLAVARRFPYPFSRFLISLARIKYYTKYLSTYGDGLVTRQHLHGKINTRFNIAQAATGRYSSSNTNLQNIPRLPIIRRAFVTFEDMLMVLADYSGIELRVLAELSGDEQLLHDVIYGNVHSAAAAQINRVSYEDFMAIYEDPSHKLHKKYSELRSRAKPFNFQLTYGASAPALSVALKCSVAEAEDAMRLWAERYPKAFQYRFGVHEKLVKTGKITMVSGREVYVPKQDRTIPVASNYPIQGAAAEVMYRAMYHVRELIQQRGLAAKMAATVHDELVTYTRPYCAVETAMAVYDGMIEGWLDVFPGTDISNLVDPTIGKNWGDKS